MVVKEERVECAEIAGRGRGLVTTYLIQAGEVVLRETPSLLCVSATASRSCCGTCLRSCPPPSALPCPGCRSAVFCSSACRSSHSAHLCAALSLLEAGGFEPRAEDKARFLLTAYELALVSPSEFQKVMDLDGDPGDEDPGDEDELVRRLHAFVSDAVRGWPWGQGAEFPHALRVTAALLKINARNAFCHMTPSATPAQRTVRGCGIYLTASLLNHDCWPNACRFDYFDSPGDSNTDIVFRALHDIYDNVEVTISYFPMMEMALGERQGRLAEEYGFSCVCDRCAIEQKWYDDNPEGDKGDNEASMKIANGNGKIANGNGHSWSPWSDWSDNDLPSENRASLSEVNHGTIANGNGHRSSDTMVNGGQREPELTKEDHGYDRRHQLFFAKYLCPFVECGGTMAPLPQSQSTVPEWAEDHLREILLTMECNMCGHVRTGADLYRDVQMDCLV